MKLPSLLAAVVIASTAPLFALTDADIAPAALVGKTLVFEIVHGGAPYATTGSWSGTFAASGNGFSVANISGDTVPVSITYSVSTGSSFELANFVTGQSPATLTLYIQDGIGKYEVSISDVYGVSVNGTFTIGAPEVKKASEITVTFGKKTELKDGNGKADFSTLLVGKKRTKNFTITNDGTAPLNMRGFQVAGKARKEFTVFGPKISQLAPGASISIGVTFAPRKIGKRKAALQILSNDKDEASFDIKLHGAGGGKM